MAKSGLESALSPSGALLASPEDDNYKVALDKMKAALDARENRMFDPQLLAIAQGMLSPTKTGSFGESLGQAAGNVLPVMQSEEKAGMENAQLRLQIAQAERAQANKLRALQLGMGGAKAPTQGAAPTQGGTESSETIKVGGQEFPSYFKNITPEIALQAGFLDAETGKLYENYIKLRNEGYKVQPGGYVDTNTTGKPVWNPFGGKALVERVIPEVNSVVKMSEQDAMELDEARRSGNGQKYYEIVDRNTKKMSRDVAPAAPASSTTTAGGAAPASANKAAPVDDKRTTVSSMEAESAAAKERATVLAKSEAERTNDVYTMSSAARANIPNYDLAQRILLDKDVQKHLGVLQRGDFSSALGNLVNEAFRVGNYSVGIPAIKGIMQTSGASQATIDKLAQLAQLEAIAQMDARKGLGSGTSVSNMEQMMASRTSPSQDDPYGAYDKKLKFMRARDEFKIKMAEEMRKSGENSRDAFESTPEFKKLFKDYRQELESIYPLESEKGKKTPSTSTGPITAESLKNRLNPKTPQ